MHRIKKMYIFLTGIKWLMFVLKNLLLSKFHTRTTGNRRLFWVRMYDVQEGLGIKNISDLVRKKSWYF